MSETEVNDNEASGSEVTDSEESDDMAETGVMNAHRAVEEMFFGMSIGNSLDAYNGTAGKLRNDGLGTENVWGNPSITKEYVDAIKSTGINVIRIPVTWYTHMDDSTYEIDPEWMERVAEVVDYTLDDNTFVILNVHHDTGTNGWLKASDDNLDWKKEVHQSIWSQIAARFEGYSDHLLFEGHNELLNDQDEWSNPDMRAIAIDDELNQIFVDTIRASGGNNAERVLLITPYAASANSKMLRGLHIPEDSIEDGIIVEIHAYTPYYFTAPEFPDDKTWDQKEVEDTLKLISTTYRIMDIPVIIGEFGATPKNNDDQVIGWAQFYVSTCKQYGMKCCWWDNGITREYAIFDRKTGDCVKPELVNALLDAAR